MRTPPRNTRTPIEPIAQRKWMIAAGREGTLSEGGDAGRVLTTRAPWITSVKRAPRKAGRPSRFAELTPQHFRGEAQQYRAMAANAPMGWIQNEFMRIAAGLDRVAEAKEAMERFRRRSLAEYTPEQLHGLARAYRDLGASATTEWTRRSFERIADELVRRAQPMTKEQRKTLRLAAALC